MSETNTMIRKVFVKKNKIETEIRKWESEGIIERVNEPVLWASPIHSVKKKDGTWRVCGDFRRLNNITKLDKYPLPSLTDFNSKMSGCKIFSKVDLKRAYHQVEIVSFYKRHIGNRAPCAGHLGNNIQFE